MSQGRKRTCSSRYSQAEYELGGFELQGVGDDQDGEFECSEELRKEWKSFKALLKSLPPRTPKKSIEKVKESLQTFNKTGLSLISFSDCCSVC
jgi:hypothetical protein